MNFGSILGGPNFTQTQNNYHISINNTWTVGSSSWDFGLLRCVFQVISWRVDEKFPSRISPSASLFWNISHHPCVFYAFRGFLYFRFRDFAGKSVCFETWNFRYYPENNPTYIFKCRRAPSPRTEFLLEIKFRACDYATSIL